MMNERQFMEAAALPAPALTLEELTGHHRLRVTLGGLLPNDILDGIFLLPQRNCICLTGPAGAGRRTLAEAFAGSAAQKGCLCYRVDEELFLQVQEDRRTECMKSLLGLAGSVPGVFLLEPEGNQDFWRAIGTAYRSIPAQTKAIILIVESDAQAAGNAGGIRDILFYEVQLPDQKDREAFFAAEKNRMPRKTSSMGEKIPSYRVLAENCEGLSYREMTQVIHTIRLQLKERAMRECGGEFDRVADALRSGVFYYTEQQFMEAVDAVRNVRNQMLRSKEAEMSVDTGRTGYAATNGFDVESGIAGFGGLQSFPSGTASDTILTEEEKARRDMLAGLELPPDPR